LTAGDAAPARRPSRRRVLGAVAALLAVAALGWTLLDSWSTVVDYDWDLRPAWLAGAALVLTAAYRLAAEAYARVAGRLHPLGDGTRAALRRHWTISLLGRYVPGNVLMVAGRLELGRGVGLPRRVSLAASVYEQILMLAASALGGLAFLALYGDLEGGAILWAVAAIPVLAVVLHPALLERLSGRLLRRAGREPLPAVLSTREMLLLFGLYVLVQAAVGVAAWMVVRGTAGPDAGALGFVALGFQLAFAVSMLAFIFPSGLGVRDGVLALVLSQNLPGGVGVAAAVLVRLAFTLFELAYAAGVVSSVRRRA